MKSSAIVINNETISIATEFLIHRNFTVMGKECIIDLFARHYRGQQIEIYAGDGENLELSGFVQFLNYLCWLFDIDHGRVTIFSHCDIHDQSFKFQKLRLGIFCSAGNYINPNFDKTRHQAQFVGTTIGRLSPLRLRIAYELDQAFPHDNYTIFQPSKDQLDANFVNMTELYATELQWLQTKQFEQDLKSSYESGTISWQDSCANYYKIWNRFEIEVVSETDAFVHQWFTEKTARCLCTGKPFVLIAGAGSLAHLNSMGFVTFNAILDESYDQIAVPGERINKIIATLTDLYRSPDRQAKIQHLYQIAEQNITQYQKYIN